MKDNEKQIEEMFNYLRECSNNAWAKGFDYAEIDNEKLKEFLTLFLEDSVVISRGEWKQIKNSLYYSKETLEKKLAKERKETAEKYKITMMLSIQEMQKYLEITEEQAKLLYYHNSEIAKQVGVEIKEN